jgi:hypothetical protein
MGSRSFPYFVTTPDLPDRGCQIGTTQESLLFLNRDITGPSRQVNIFTQKLDHKLKEEVSPHFADFPECCVTARKSRPWLNDKIFLGHRYEKSKLIFMRRWWKSSQDVVVFNFNDRKAAPVFPVPPGQWRKRFNSAEKIWQGKCSQIAGQFFSRGELTLTADPCSCILYTCDSEEI